MRIAYHTIRLLYSKIHNPIVSLIRYISISLYIVSYRKIHIAYRSILTIIVFSISICFCFNHFKVFYWVLSIQTPKQKCPHGWAWLGMLAKCIPETTALQASSTTIILRRKPKGLEKII